MGSLKYHTEEELLNLKRNNRGKTPVTTKLATSRYMKTHKLKIMQIPIELHTILTSKRFGKSVRESAINIADMINKMAMPNNLGLESPKPQYIPADIQELL